MCCLIEEGEGVMVVVVCDVEVIRLDVVVVCVLELDIGSNDAM